MVPGDVGEVAAADASSCPWPIGLPEWPELSVLEWEAASLRLYEPLSGTSGKAVGLLAGISLPPMATRESGVGGEESEALWLPAESSCHGILSLALKALVEEAVLLCVAVKEVASMPLSVEAP